MNRKRSAGFTVIEVCMAMAMIAVALMALMASIVSAMALVETNRQEAQVLGAVRQKIAELESYDFTKLFADYKGSKGAFSIVGLDDDADKKLITNPNDPTEIIQAATGQILFPVNASGHLDETLSDSSFRGFNFPRDLNMNGNATDTNCDTTYLILPIKIRVQWACASGGDDVNGVKTRTVEYNVILTKLK